MAIIGQLSQIHKYFTNPTILSCVPYLEEALNPSSEVYKRITSAATPFFSKVVLDEKFYALEQKYTTKERKNCFFESHKKFVDIQLVIAGSEIIEHTDISHLQLSEDHSVERDLLMYHPIEHANKLLLTKGCFAVFFPEDAHMGGQYHLQALDCSKTVIKMPLEEFLKQGRA